jgi:hypothetical protein
MNAVRQALSTSISSLFLLGVMLMIAGLVVVVFLKEVPLRRTHTLPEHPEPDKAAAHTPRADTRATIDTV